MNLDKSTYYPSSGPELPPEQSDLPEQSDQSDRSDNSESGQREPGLRARDTGVDAVAHLLSWALVPLLMPVYGTLLAFTLSILSFTPAGVKIFFTLTALGINVVIPAIIIAFLKKVGIVHDVGLNEQKERLIPYLVCILCLVATALLFSHRGAPAWLVMFYFGGAAAGVVEAVINRWWKISVHAAGIAGLVALLIRMLHNDFCMPQTLTWLLIAVAAAGLLGSARIWLGRHTLAQVLAGYTVGFIGVYFLI